MSIHIGTVGLGEKDEEVIQLGVLMPRECSIPLDGFTDLFRVFIRYEPQTIQIEQMGLAIRQAMFADQKQVAQFVQQVCRWGGYAGIATRVLQKNAPKQIAMALQSATNILTNPNPDVGLALGEVVRLKDLGVSFASKHLRFLFPNLCPVLDSIISERMDYQNDLDGYRKLAGDCVVIATTLTREHIENPVAERQGLWRTADVEASLYAYVNEWK